MSVEGDLMIPSSANCPCEKVCTIPARLEWHRGSLAETTSAVYKYFLKCLTEALDERKRECLAGKRVSSGDRYIMPQAFKVALEKLLDREGICRPAPEATLDSPWAALIRKRIDFAWKQANNPTVFVELKTWVSSNEIGAAVFEAMIAKQHLPECRFYVVSLSSPSSKNNIKEVISQGPFKQYLDGLFVWDTAEDIEAFIAEMKKNGYTKKA